MKAQVVKQFGTRQCGVVSAKGLTLYVSYGTVVGVKLPGAAVAAFTNKKYSPTTTRQLSECLLPAADHYVWESHSNFVTRLANLGLSVRQHRANNGAVTRDVNSPVNLQRG